MQTPALGSCEPLVDQVKSRWWAALVIFDISYLFLLLLWPKYLTQSKWREDEFVLVHGSETRVHHDRKDMGAGTHTAVAMGCHSFLEIQEAEKEGWQCSAGFLLPPFSSVWDPIQGDKDTYIQNGPKGMFQRCPKLFLSLIKVAIEIIHHRIQFRPITPISYLIAHHHHHHLPSHQCCCHHQYQSHVLLGTEQGKLLHIGQNLEGYPFL